MQDSTQPPAHSQGYVDRLLGNSQSGDLVAATDGTSTRFRFVKSERRARQRPLDNTLHQLPEFVGALKF